MGDSYTGQFVMLTVGYSTFKLGQSNPCQNRLASFKYNILNVFYPAFKRYLDTRGYKKFCLIDVNHSLLMLTDCCLTRLLNESVNLLLNICCCVECNTNIFLTFILLCFYAKRVANFRNKTFAFIIIFKAMHSNTK